MKVCVVGCGAVGSLFAANLATLEDVEVWAYDLAQEHVDAINRDGLRLTGAGEVVGRPSDLGHLVKGLMDEGKAVAAAVGVELREDPWEMNVLATRRGSAHLPSMLEDVEAHRRTEIDMITGALVREAHRVGVPVPLHETMERLIKAKEDSWS